MCECEVIVLIVLSIEVVCAFAVGVSDYNSLVYLFTVAIEHFNCDVLSYFLVASVRS